MIPIEILIIFLLILANGLLAMAEIAVVSARKVRLQQRIEQGDKRAQIALDLALEPGRFLSTVQIGITLVGILAGAFGGATVAKELAPLLAQVQGLAPYANALSVAIVVVTITYLTLVLGELAPKQIGLRSPERIATLVARPMNFLARLNAPIVSLLTGSTNLVLRLLGVGESTEPSVTEEEVRMLIGQGADIGVFEPLEEEIFEQIFRLGDRRVSSLMTPRPDVIWIDLKDPDEVCRQTILEGRLTHYPVAEGDLDDLLGYVRANDLLAQCMEGRPIDVRAVLQTPVVVPESMRALDVLERFKAERAQIAFALDEYGGIQGIITLRDILEAIVGDIPQQHEVGNPEIVQREDGSWLVDGMLPVEEFKDLLELGTLPGEELKVFQTVGGFVMTYLGEVPRPGDVVEWDSLRIEVVDMDGNRVDKLLVALLPESGSKSRED